MINLNVHSSYEFLASNIQIDPLLKLLKDDGQSAVAITDLNHMHGIYQLLKKAPEYNIKPIVGMEVIVEDGLSGIPLILLAKNNQGYQSLIRISAMLSYKDIIRTPFEFLKNNANDLLIIAGTDEGAGLLGELTKVSDDDKYI